MSLLQTFLLHRTTFAMPTPSEIASEKLHLAAACDLSQVRARFCKLYDVSPDTALAAERELIRYFVLSEAFPKSDHGMYGPVIDEYWHVFLVFTLLYVNFCRDVIGAYIHHVPNPEIPAEAKGATSAPSGPESTFEDFQTDYTAAFGESLPEIWRQPAPLPRR